MPDDSQIKNNNQMVCINLSKDQFNVINKNLPNDINFISTSFNNFWDLIDLNMVFGLIVNWDGEGQHCHQILSKFRETYESRVVPIYAIAIELQEEEKLLAEELGIQNWISLNDNSISQMFDNLKFRKDNFELIFTLDNKFYDCLEIKDFDAAKKIASSLILIDSRNVTHMLLIAKELEKTKKYKEAEDCYKKVLNSKKHYIKALSSYSVLLAKDNRPNESQEIGKLIEEISPTLFEAQIQVGGIKKFTNKDNKNIIKQFSSLNSDKKIHNYYLSQVKSLMDMGNYERSIKYAKIKLKTTNLKSIKQGLSENIAKIQNSSKQKTQSKEPSNKEISTEQKFIKTYKQSTINYMDNIKNKTKPKNIHKKINLLIPASNDSSSKIFYEIEHTINKFSKISGFDATSSPIENGGFLLFGQNKKFIQQTSSMLKSKEASIVICSKNITEFLIDAFTKNFNAIILEYSVIDPNFIKALHTLDSNRSSRLPTILLYCKSESIHSNLIHKEVISSFEKISLYPKTSRDLESDLKSAFLEPNNNLLWNAINKIRCPHFEKNLGLDYGILDQNSFNKFIEQIDKDRPNTDLKLIEEISFLYLKKEWGLVIDKCLENSQLLSHKNINIYLADAYIATGKKEEAGAVLIEFIEKSHHLNEEDLFQIGFYLAKTENIKHLYLLIDIWSNRDSLTSTPRYYFLLSLYSTSAGFEADSEAFINKAVTSNPSDYIILTLYALMLMKNEKYKVAAKLWGISLNLLNTNERTCLLNMAECQLKDKQRNKAEATINELLLRSPKFPPALDFKRKYLSRIIA